MNHAAVPRRKLIEVSIPLEVINRESAREKSIRHGHPSTLHLWWARRPLAACRAVLFAQLVDDPSSCPEEFQTKAAQDAERDRLHKLIGTLVPWEASSNETILNAARYEIARSVARGRGEKLPPIGQMRPQQIIEYLQTHAPPVYDPFSGGGSIPLEAQRLGLKAMGSDLNPVAVLIGKALVEFPSKFAGRKPMNPDVNELHQWKGAQGLADDVRYYGRWMREQAEKKIGHLYPKVKLKDGTGTAVIAWLWVRTVPSPDPRAKGAHVPLASTFLLSSKEGKQTIIRPVVNRDKTAWAFEIDEKPSKADFEKARKGTKAARGANFACLLTGAAIDDTHVKSEAKAGRMSTALMAIVAEGPRSRIYLAPTPEQMKAAQVDAPEVPEIDQPLPNDPRNFWTVQYGLDSFAKLFTTRQLVALTTFSDLVVQAREKMLTHATKHWSGAHADDTRTLAEGGLGPVAYADAVATYLVFAINKLSTRSCTQTAWYVDRESTMAAFSRQAIQMTWDFAEMNTLLDGSGSFGNAVDWTAETIENLAVGGSSGSISNLDATKNSYPVRPVVISTDPPYYDNIGYADLSDFFYVWLRRALTPLWPNLFRRIVTPKNEELVATPYRHGGKSEAESFFMEGMSKALAAVRNAATEDPLAIYYAFKQSELADDGVTSAGWSSFLQAVVDAGLIVDGTWPMRTEQPHGLRAMKSNSLASSIVLVCRRREGLAATITRADFLRALRREMPAALTEIRHAGVGPTDIQQAAIGPGIGIFTRHAQVLNTDGTQMLVKDALKLINQVREEITSHGDAEYDSETRFALDWFSTKGFDKGKSGDAILMANALGLGLGDLERTKFFVADSGVARLLARNELSDGWDPGLVGPATVWAGCQHMIKRLTAENGGVDAAAALYNRLGGLAEPAHALARRLYDICEQRQWAAEGYAYNRLHQEWDAIEKRAAALAEASGRRDLFSR
jgi:putative DNA methylase